jgi:CysZ protein
MCRMGRRLRDENVLVRFGVGFAAPFRGAAFLAARPVLWCWVGLPVALMAAGVVFAAWFVWTQLPGLVMAFAPPPSGGPFVGLWFGLLLVLMGLAFVVAVVVIGSAATVLATPFYDVLADRVEAEVRGEPPPPVTLDVVLRDAARSIAHTVLALALYAAAIGILGVLGLVPGVDLVVPVLGGAVTATFLARELLDVPLARRRAGFGAKLAYLWRHFAAFEGLGLAATLLLWVPLLNFLSMPMAVVGATLLYCRLEADGDGIDAA